MRQTVLICLILLLTIPSISAQPDEDGVYLPPQYATDETFALVAVNRANLRTAPSITEGVVVDIARWGDRYPIVGIFYTGDMTVREPGTDEFVFDDPNEREVWYLLDTGNGQVWIFGGVVLVSNPDPLEDLIDNRNFSIVIDNRMRCCGVFHHGYILRRYKLRGARENTWTIAERRADNTMCQNRP